MITFLLFGSHLHVYIIIVIILLFSQPVIFLKSHLNLLLFPIRMSYYINCAGHDCYQYWLVKGIWPNLCDQLLWLTTRLAISLIIWLIILSKMIIKLLFDLLFDLFCKKSIRSFFCLVSQTVGQMVRHINRWLSMTDRCHPYVYVIKA